MPSLASAERTGSVRGCADSQPVSCRLESRSRGFNLLDRRGHAIRKRTRISYYVDVALCVHGDERTIAFAPENPHINGVLA